MTEVYVTDTHPLVWFTGGAHRKLGRRAREAFTAFEAGEIEIRVPVPVVIEAWFLVENGTIRPKTTFAAWWRDLKRAGLTSESLAVEDVLSASALDWSHPDPFDRMIVAITQRLDLPLLTADAAITDSELVDVVW